MARNAIAGVKKKNTDRMSPEEVKRTGVDESTTMAVTGFVITAAIGYVVCQKKKGEATFLLSPRRFLGLHLEMLIPGRNT